jgi:integrase
MPKYRHDPGDILLAQDVLELFNAANSTYERVLISLLWMAGPRPTELLMLTTRDFSLKWNCMKDMEMGGQILCAQNNPSDERCLSCNKERGKAPDILIIEFQTLKTHSDNQRFSLKTRKLSFVRPKERPSIYIECVLEHLNRLKFGERLIPFTKRWAEKRISKLGIQVLDKPISPYHFRHSAITRESSLNHSTPQLMHFKGAKSARSVESYEHARPYDVQF